MSKDFSKKDLRGRSFRGQDLTGADFSGADLRGVDFRDASLCHANFHGARLGKRWRSSLWLGLGMLLAGVLLGFFMAVGTLFMSIVFRDIVINIRWELNGSLGGLGALVFYLPLILSLLRAVHKRRFWSSLLSIFSMWSVSLTVVVASTVAVTSSVSITIVIAIAGTVAIAVAGSIASAIAGSIAAAFCFAGAFTSIFTFTVAVAVAGAFADAIASSIAPNKLYFISFLAIYVLLMLPLQLYIAYYTLSEDSQFLSLRRLQLMLSSFGGTNFKGAQLHDANFSQADLKQARFAGADLSRTAFHGALNAHRAHAGQTLLREPSIRDLLVTGQGANANLRLANLTGANLSRADLSHADLTQAQCVGADFSGVIFTGACLEAWNIDSTTVLQDVQADYVYLLQNQQERRPASGNFASGEFTKFFQEVLDTVDLIFREGVDWKAFLISLNNLKVAAGDSGEEIEVQSIENKGDNTFVVRLNVPPEIDKAAIHEQFRQDYEYQLAILETQYKAKLEAKDEVIGAYKNQNTDLMQIIRTQAERPFTNINTEQNIMSTFDQRGQKVGTQHNVAGDMQQGDKIDFSGATITGSHINIKSRLENVTQTIGALPNTDAEEKAKLEDLLKQLTEALQQVPADKAEEVETVTAMTEQTVNAAKSGNKSMLSISAKGLTEAAKALAGVTPAAVGIVKQIVETLVP